MGNKKNQRLVFRCADQTSKVRRPLISRSSTSFVSIPLPGLTRRCSFRECRKRRSRFRRDRDGTLGRGRSVGPVLDERSRRRGSPAEKEVSCSCRLRRGRNLPRLSETNPRRFDAHDAGRPPPRPATRRPYGPIRSLKCTRHRGKCSSHPL